MNIPKQPLESDYILGGFRDYIKKHLPPGSGEEAVDTLMDNVDRKLSWRENVGLLREKFPGIFEDGYRETQQSIMDTWLSKTVEELEAFSEPERPLRLLAKRFDFKLSKAKGGAERNALVWDVYGRRNCYGKEEAELIEKGLREMGYETRITGNRHFGEYRVELRRRFSEPAPKVSTE